MQGTQLGPLWWTRRMGRGVRKGHEGINVYIELVHFKVQQILTQHLKATTFQEKNFSWKQTDLNFKKPLLLRKIYSIYKSRENIPMFPCLASKMEHMVYLASSMSPIPSAISPSPNQFSSVQLHSRVRLCDPRNRSTSGLPVHHHLPEFTQTHIHWVGDAIQPSHSLCPLVLLPPILPSIRVFSNESTLHMRWPDFWSFSFSIIPSKEHPGLIS